jgi:diphthamide biosynthesis protein 3
MSIYEEVEIEDMVFDEAELAYTYPCPCGDRFRITLEELWDGEDVAKCPSCTLRIQVIYEESDLPPLPEEEDDSDEDKEGEAEEEEEHEDELVDKLQAVAIKSKP